MRNHNLAWYFNLVSCMCFDTKGLLGGWIKKID